LRVIKEADPCRGSGQAYSAEEIDYFWTQLAARIEEIPTKYRRAVQRREPSPRFQQAIMRLVDQGKVLTATGRLRFGASYCARHNTLFQGLAADGAKLALYDLVRAGYRVVAFVHDEVVVEVPETADVEAEKQKIKTIMVEAMRRVCPDVAIDAELVVAKCWSKN